MTDIQSAACLISVLLCFLIGQKLPVKQLINDKQSQHLVFASTVSLFLLWMVQTGIAGSPSVHFLWLSALPLVIGFRWAVVSTLLALLALTVLGIESYEMLGINFLAGCLAPIALTYGIYSLTFHKLPKNVFVYIFLCAFIPGALTIGLKMLLLSGYFYIDGLYSWQYIMDNYLMLSTLLVFPEAMFNGMTITLLIIYKPHWVYTFHDKHYLDKKS
ncbi:energy-coupling factor ABC transporter permease [Paraglaciecola sp.]|uniref:energy-coupling factor ABC transporter permease n=1 Tax=Paraglaciecola sp. TaxID=1920173 RepID=UPI0030F3DCE2